MVLFKRRRNKKYVADEGQSVMVNKWKAYKQRIAAYLQQKSELLSIQTKKYSLILFCLLFGGSSVVIAVHSALVKDKQIAISKISKPAHSIMDDKNYLQADSSITKREYDRVIQFKKYLLQLKNDSTTKEKFDSIVHARPQLIDSINQFEKKYLQQK